MQFQRNRTYLVSGTALNELIVTMHDMFPTSNHAMDIFMQHVKNCTLDGELIEELREELSIRAAECVAKGGHWVDNQGHCHECGAKVP